MDQVTHNMTKDLFIDLQVQCMKTTSSEHGENMCAKIVLNVKIKTDSNLCAQHVFPMFCKYKAGVQTSLQSEIHGITVKCVKVPVSTQKRQA